MPTRLDLDVLFPLSNLILCWRSPLKSCSQWSFPLFKGNDFPGRQNKARHRLAKKTTRCLYVSPDENRTRADCTTATSPRKPGALPDAATHVLVVLHHPHRQRRVRPQPPAAGPGPACSRSAAHGERGGASCGIAPALRFPLPEQRAGLAAAVRR